MRLADRLLAKVGLRRMPQSGGRRASMWSGGSLSRMYQDWQPWTFSPDYESRWTSRFMRARARELARNNPYAAGFRRALGDNVIGPDGIMLQAKITKADGETLAETTNDAIEDAWGEWSYPENASADGRDSWVDLQRLATEGIAVDGEVFIRRLRGFGNDFGYALQFIDPDLVDELYNLGVGPNQNEIRQGIELDRYNRPVAYHVWNRYPTEQNGLPYERIRIPASDMLHLFVRYRPNQTRGITWFAPILIALYDLGEYQKNEGQASKAGAGKMGFIKNLRDEAIAAFSWGDSKPDDRKSFEVESGLIAELLPGQEFEAYDPSHPATTFDMFSATVLQSIARGLNISHLTLSGDVRRANYSSMRAGLQPERDHWRSLHQFLACHFHRPVYRDWIQMALVNGAVAVDSRLAANYYAVKFAGRGWEWVDPKNDLEASKLEIDLGLNNRQRLCAERGVDFYENLEALGQERDAAEEVDLDISGNQISGVNPASVSPQGVQDDATSSGSDGSTPPSDSGTAGALRLLNSGGATL